MPRRKSPTPTTEPFVVVVRFPSSPKEYHYLCNDPSVRQGSNVIANGTRVGVVRTTAWTADSPATRFVQRDTVVDERKRRYDILCRLNDLARDEEAIARYTKLKSPEARRLVAELKELCK